MRQFRILASFAVSLVAAGAGTPIERALKDLEGVKQFIQAAIAPDGSKVAWAEAAAEPGRTSIFVTGLGDGTKPKRITAAVDGSAAEQGIAWSPDGTKIAFLSDARDKGQLALYVADASGKGSPRKLTSLTGFLAAPMWSPDGRQIAFLFTENAPRTAGPLEAMTPPSGDMDEKIYEQRIAVVAASGGPVKQLSPADKYVYEYDWSPDGKRFVYTAAPGPGDNNWYLAQLYILEAASGEAASIYKPSVQIAVPKWSTDGARVAFIGGLMSDEGSVGGEIFVIPAAGGEPRNLTPGRSSSPSWLTWTAPDRILFSENAGGSSAVSALDTKNGASETLWRGDESIHAGDAAFSVARDGRTLALLRSSWALAPEVWAGQPGDLRQVTHANSASHAAWGEARNIEWLSDGFHVQGWLVTPAGFNPSDKTHRYPLVVSVHGGPAVVLKPGWPGAFFDLSLLASEGYFVFFPNPRGSYGQGEAFTRGNVKDFGYGDLRDILAGVDRVAAVYPVDAARIGIAGWSYGGFMTMWAVTQTNRFRAAVAGAGLSNWQSYYGENSIDQWMIPYFGASVYDDPAVYARSSAINYVKRVKTPTLVLVGERDGEVPAPQSFEYWHALKTLGVKTRMVVYPGEGHRFHEPAHIADVLNRTVDWFNENMPASP